MLQTVNKSAVKSVSAPAVKAAPVKAAKKVASVPLTWVALPEGHKGMRNAHLNAGFAFDGETGRLSIVLETRKGTFKSEPSSTGKTNLITAINGRIQLPDEIVAALEAEGYTGVGGNVNIYAK